MERKDKVLEQWQDVCDEIHGRQYEDVELMLVLDRLPISKRDIVYRDWNAMQINSLDSHIIVYINRQEDGTTRGTINIFSDNGEIKSWHSGKQYK